MKWNNRINMRLSFRPLSSAFLLTLATSASAAPGDLSEVPLYTRGSAEPNIMFVLDSSGSMYQVVLPPEDYDSEADDPCSGTALDNTYRYQQGGNWRTDYFVVNYRVNKSTGAVQFKRIAPRDDDESDNNWMTWNSTSNCFAENSEYEVRFYADGNDGSYWETGNHQDYSYLNLHDDSSTGSSPRQTGHFLNWFFSDNSTGTYLADYFLEEDGTTVRRAKLGVDRRTEIMKDSATDLLSDLSDVRVGLMQFDASGNANGGQMLAGLTSISEENLPTLLSSISGIGVSGGTPLGETFEDVGRYFITGYEDKNISITLEDADGVVSSQTKKGEEVFESEPIWGSVTEPTATETGGAIQFYCQKSFMVALTDGDPTSDGGVGDELDDYDYNCDGVKGCTTGSNDSMDDVIKALYDIDLRPDLTEPDGTAVKHNITSYMIGFANSNLSNSNVLTNSGYFGSGYHSGDSTCSGDDCSYVYSADNASELKTTFSQIIRKVHAIVGSSSSVAFNSTSLEENSTLYAAKFDSGDWSGELSALSIGSDGSISSTASWEAGNILDQADISQRVILTHDGSSGVPYTEAGLDFTDSDSNVELDLNINTSTGVAVQDGRAADRIAYQRGDRTNEGNSTSEFRQRGSRLGDIVNSTPVYLGAPTSSWENENFPEASSYAAFKSGKASRTPMVYVGANDGFLHGFNAAISGTNAGKELIAYAPSALVSSVTDEGVHFLSSQNYSHKYYVDGTPTVGDAYIGTGWKTVLVGGLGGGGKGYFALDVSDPGNFTEANAASLVLWEFTDNTNSNLGYSFSRPQIGRMSNGKWAAIFGNGYNSYTGDAGLFIVYLDGSGYVYLTTATGSQGNKNGLSTPAIVDSDLDGTIDRIYAGDLRGNMWAFDVESTGQWAVESNGGTATPLFTASGEPITAAPLVARNTAYESGAGPNLLVTFGTGQYLTATDTADTSAGGFYAVSDNGTYGLDADDLVSRTIGEEDVAQDDGGVITLRTLSGSELNWTSDSGWYIPLDAGTYPDGGERVTTRPDLLRNVLFFNTLIPTGQVCSAGGYGWLMSVDVRTGLPPAKFAVFDANGDGVIDSADMNYVGELVDEGIPNKPGFLGAKRQYTSTSAGTINERDVNVGGGEREGRLSWEEITPE
ncbi:pilus assembly protein [Microbulbifer sp. ALW1]|uniref:pilus assembly protein n=1 Tax=Microbulbifer sp. (strain ALW1) TaxID=1516059 RepID=UPI001358C54C|nr:PilC/PilY family type IV pilus protein [Microbulbifer sp. ALW1]